VPLQKQQQPHSNPAAGASLSSTAAASTAQRGLPTVDNSAMQQHPQPHQRSPVYQQAGYTGQTNADEQHISEYKPMHQLINNFAIYHIPPDYQSILHHQHDKKPVPS
jgi:hypothetical protein